MISGNNGPRKPVCRRVPRPARRGASPGGLAGRSAGRSRHPLSSHAAERRAGAARRGRRPARVAFLPSTTPASPPPATRSGWCCWAGFSEQRCVLVDLEPATGRASEPGEAFSELRPLASELPAAEAGLLAYARALNIWRANHRFCGRCGAPDASPRAPATRGCAPPATTRAFRGSIRPSSCWCTTASRRCSAGRPAGRPIATPPSPASSNPANRWKMPCGARCCEETGVTAPHHRLPLLAALAVPGLVDAGLHGARRITPSRRCTMANWKTRAGSPATSCAPAQYCCRHRRPFRAD